MALIDKLTAIADGFRSSRGTTEPLSLEQMAVLAAEPIGGGGGGLPDNIAALDCGVYTVSSASTTTVSVPHNMGVKPDFCVWMLVKSCETVPAAYTNVTGCILAKPCVLSGSSSTIYEVFQAITGYNASKSLARTASAVATNPMTETNACIAATTAYKLLAGDTYIWIAGKFDTSA